MAQVLPVFDKRRVGTCLGHIPSWWHPHPGMGFSLDALESCLPGMSSVPYTFLGLYCQSFSSSCIFATVSQLSEHPSKNRS